MITDEHLDDDNKTELKCDELPKINIRGEKKKK